MMQSKRDKQRGGIAGDLPIITFVPTQPPQELVEGFFASKAGRHFALPQGAVER